MTAARSDLPTLDGRQRQEDDDKDVDTLGHMTHNRCLIKILNKIISCNQELERVVGTGHLDRVR